MGFNADNVEVRVGGCTTPDTSPATIQNGAREQYDVTGCTFSSGDKLSEALNVTYDNSDTGLTHVAQGEIVTRVE